MKWHVFFCYRWGIKCSKVEQVQPYLRERWIQQCLTWPADERGNMLEVCIKYHELERKLVEKCILIFKEFTIFWIYTHDRDLVNKSALSV